MNKFNISKTEIFVMEAIWQGEPCSAEQVIERLNRSGEWHEKTTKTLLYRLLKKGAIEHQKKGRQYWYSACIQKEEFRKQQSNSFVGEVFNGKVSHLVAAFAQENSLSQSDVSELKAIIDQWEQDND